MKQAPDFSLPDQNNQVHRLSDYLGRWVVVYFYPKDDTPGCTKEACSFRDGREELEKNQVTVLGISADSIQSHHKFAQKHQLNFTLLSDPDKKIIKQYGSWGNKTLFGRVFEGIQRNTFLINPDGKIVKEYRRVSPADHAVKILKDLKELNHV